MLFMILQILTTITKFVMRDYSKTESDASQLAQSSISITLALSLELLALSYAATTDTTPAFQKFLQSLASSMKCATTMRLQTLFTTDRSTCSSLTEIDSAAKDVSGTQLETSSGKFQDM